MLNPMLLFHPAKYHFSRVVHMDDFLEALVLKLYIHSDSNTFVVDEVHGYVNQKASTLSGYNGSKMIF